MVITTGYFNLLPLKYQKALTKLNQDLEKAEKITSKNKYLRNFAEKYTILPEFAKYWFSFLFAYQKNISQCRWHAKWIKEKISNDFPERKIMAWPIYTNFEQSNPSPKEKFETIKFLSGLPHSNLSLCFEIYQQISGTFISKAFVEKYKKACEIYAQIGETDIKDGQKLVNLFEETKNHEFVVKNIECRLAKMPLNQSLWKAYIEYLENDKTYFTDLLKVLSRYCHLFVEDKIMREKYQSLIEKVTKNSQKVAEYWIDSIKFEYQFTSIEAAKYLFLKALDARILDAMKFFDFAYEFVAAHKLDDVYKKVNEAKYYFKNDNPSSIDEKFNKILTQRTFNNPLKQPLPFKQTLSVYVFDRLTPFHWQNLYQTCKYFFYIHRLSIVQKMIVKQKFVVEQNISIRVSEFEYSENSVLVSSCPLNPKDTSDIWLAHTLSIQDKNGGINRLLKKCVRIELKYLHFSNTSIYQNQFEILTQSRTIENLCLYKTLIKRKGLNENLSMDKILERIPKLRYLSIYSIQINPDTSNNLLLLNFENKIKYFTLEETHASSLDHELFFQFLENNLAPKSSISLCRIWNGNPNGLAFMNNKFSNWIPKDEAPILSHTSQFDFHISVSEKPSEIWQWWN